MNSNRAFRILSVVALMVCFTAPALLAESAISLGSIEATQARVIVPVLVSVGDGDNVQALAFRVRYSPENAVRSITIRRAGVLENLTPLFEAQPRHEATASYLASFDQNSQRINFAEGENLVAEIEVTLADGVAEGTRIQLSLDPSTTALSNQEGTVELSPGKGNLRLRDGGVDVRTRREKGPKKN